MKNDPIFFWVSDGCGFIRLRGDACFLNAASVRDFAKTSIECGVKLFVVDMRDCEGLDSTFMGSLAGIALRLKELDFKDKMELVGLKPEHVRQFKNLGLDNLFSW